MTQRRSEFHRDAVPERSDRATVDPRGARPAGTRAVNLLVGILVVMWVACLSSDIASIVRIWNRSGADLPVARQTRGVIDVSHVGRARMLVLSLTGTRGEFVMLGCPTSTHANRAACPSDADHWNARMLTVDWIGVPTGLMGEVVQRATRITDANEVVFAASVADVQAAEVSAAVYRIEFMSAVFVPMILLFAAAARLMRRQARASAERVEAARQRSFVNSNNANPASHATDSRL